MNYTEIAKKLKSAPGKCYFTGEKPDHDDLLVMISEADHALRDTFGLYTEATVVRVVRKMLIQNDTASRICAKPLSLEQRV